MAFRCAGCGGSMVFDVGLQRMRCLHCDNTCEPEEFSMRDVGYGSRDEGDLRIYTCRGCGAVLEGTEDSMVGFCPYCGGQALTSETATDAGTESIVPFQVSKESCVERYGEHVLGIPFMPREFRDPAFIERFCGIYLPFWQYDIRFGNGGFKGTKTVLKTHDYDVIGTFSIEVRPDGDGKGAGVETFDASRYLDDELAQRALPIRPHDVRPYHPAYLSGFYADRSTVDGEVYYEDAKRRAQGRMLRAMADEIEETHDIFLDDKVSNIKTTLTDSHSVLVPLWFLTWRKDDRVAYAVVNGDTGKVVCDMPLDLCALALACVLLALAIFGALELFVQPTPQATCMLSLVAAMGMARGIQLSARRELAHIYHLKDKGYGAKAPEGVTATKPKEKKRKHKGNGEDPSENFLFGLALVFFAVLFLSDVMDGDGGNVDGLATTLVTIIGCAVPFAALAMVLMAASEVCKLHGHPSMRTPLVATVLMALSIVVNTAMLVIAPVNDGWYYAGDALAILVLVVSAYLMLRAYNVSCTRPVPRLFDREEVQQ